MQLFKTTHETDWRRVQWVHDTSHETRGSYAYDTEAETKAAEDHEIEGLNNGTLIVLGALVEVKCPHCRHWQDSDSLWGIVVKVGEDLEAYGTECLNIPENILEGTKHFLSVCEESPSGDTKPDVTERRQIPPPKTIEHLPDWLKRDMGLDYHDGLPVPPPPEGPPNTLEKEGDTFPTFDLRVRSSAPRVLPLGLPASSEVGELPDDDLRKHADYMEDCTGVRPIWCLSRGKARRIPDRS